MRLAHELGYGLFFTTSLPCKSPSRVFLGTDSLLSSKHVVNTVQDLMCNAAQCHAHLLRYEVIKGAAEDTCYGQIYRGISVSNVSRLGSHVS